ncbi:hypothetical protein N2152v2_006379 [Parachlorella kessleri]
MHRRFRTRLKHPACPSGTNLAVFAVLFLLIVFLHPVHVNVSILFLGGSQGFSFGDTHQPWGPAFLKAREEQEQFCRGLPEEYQLNPPHFLDVPWTQGAQGPNSTTRLALRTGLQGRTPGAASQPFSQYLFEANDIVSGLMMRDGEWEAYELTQILHAMQQFARYHKLDPKDIYFLDIGANVGVYTLFMAAYGFSVIAFEPLHVNVMALRHSLCANPGLRERVTLVTKALGNESHTCGIWSLDTNQGDGTVVCQDEVSATFGPELKRRQDLEISRLDDELAGVLHELAGRVGAVKIDVEGHELAVVKGAQRFFDLVKPAGVMAECNDAMMATATGEGANSLFRKMHELGYTVHQESFTGKVVPPSLFSVWTEPKIVNYWFVRRKGT